jgi:D-amino peptidase
MRILISCDMEGISGIVDWKQTQSGESEWERCRRLMIGDVNAAVEAAFEFGVNEVVVTDAHAKGRNLMIEELNPRAALNSGATSPFSMMQGIGDIPVFDAVIFVGYHARARTKDAILCHTWSNALADVWLNDIQVGEIGLNAATAGYFNVPVIAISGDKAACLEAQRLLGKEICIAIVKEGSSRYAAKCLPLTEARQSIRIAVTKGLGALKAKRNPKPLLVKKPVKLVVDYMYPNHADLASIIPRAQREDATRVLFEAEDILEAIRAFQAMTNLASA